MSVRPIHEVLESHKDRLMAIPGVVGVGQGLCDDRPCIKVFAATITPTLEQRVPARLEGYPVRIEETGTFRAPPPAQADSL